jgi:hypothetical protein
VEELIRDKHQQIGRVDRKRQGLSHLVTDVTLGYLCHTVEWDEGVRAADQLLCKR